MTKTKTTRDRTEVSLDELPDALRAAIDAAKDKKALDVVVLDLRGSGAFTDYFVLCSGQSTRQVKAIVDGIQQRLRALDARPSHVEGYGHAEWVLLDCFDFIIHVFTGDTRRFYDLERLWGSARRIEVREPASPRTPT